MGREWSVRRSRSLVAMGDGISFLWVFLPGSDSEAVGLFLETVFLALRWLEALPMMVPLPVCSTCGCDHDAHVHLLRYLSLKLSLPARTRRSIRMDGWLRENAVACPRCSRSDYPHYRKLRVRSMWTRACFSCRRGW